MVRPSSETRGRPMKSSVLVKSEPHCDCKTLTTFKSSPAASTLAPSPERKCTWVSPLYQPLGVHVRPAVEPQLELTLSGLDFDLAAQRLVFEPAGHVHQHAAGGQPALAAAVDIGVGGLVEPQVAADVHVPGVVLGVEVRVMPVGLIGHAFRRAKVDAAGDRPPGSLIHDARVHPGAPGLC